MLNQYRFLKGQFAVDFCAIDLSGTDVNSFLQKQSTFDINKIDDQNFQLISFLDPHGKVESFGWLIKDKHQFSYLVCERFKDQTLRRLNQFLISEDVEISLTQKNNWRIVIGPKAGSFSDGFKGEFFGESAWLLNSEKIGDTEEINPQELEKWRVLTGYPKFDGSESYNEIINNTVLFNLAVSFNKGCYPGQETVSKIHNNRGAAYAPVLIELSSPAQVGEIILLEKKIGSSISCQEWHGKFYLECKLLRDFRIENYKLNFDLNNITYSGVVKYLPFLKGDRKSKAEELTWLASEFFKKDNFESAEECLRMAIDIDPSYSDAFESLGVMLGRLERFSEAVDVMKELLVVQPHSVLAHTNMSLYLMRMGKIQEAEEQKSQATLKSFKAFGEEAKFKKELDRQKQEKQEEWHKREKMFYQVLEIDPDDTLANYGLGSILVEKSEWELARDHLEKVLAVDPKYSVAYLALGRALKGLGRKEEARKIWTEGIKIAGLKGDLMPANQMQSEIDSLY